MLMCGGDVWCVKKVVGGGEGSGAETLHTTKGTAQKLPPPSQAHPQTPTSPNIHYDYSGYRKPEFVPERPNIREEFVFTRTSFCKYARVGELNNLFGILAVFTPIPTV